MGALVEIARHAETGPVGGREGPVSLLDGTVVSYAAAPLRPELLFPWAASLRQVAPTARVVLLADPAPAYEVLQHLYDIEVHQASLRRDPFDVGPEGMDQWRGAVSVYRDRWDEIAKLTDQDGPVSGTVLLTDARDVVFQRNPFPQIVRDDCAITVASEGVTYKNDVWNRQYLMQGWPTKLGAMINRETICAGVVGGEASTLHLLARAVHAALEGKTGMWDQTALNLVLRSEIFAPHVRALPYSEGWCCHCAQMITPWARENAKLIPRLEEMPKVSESGHLVTRKDMPFAIVHHWPMVPQLSHFGTLK